MAICNMDMSDLGRENQNPLGILRLAVENQDVVMARATLRRSASPWNMSFELVMPLCRQLVQWFSDDDTLSAVAYGLWELGLPSQIQDGSEVIDFMLELMGLTRSPVVYGYASELILYRIGDCCFVEQAQLEQLLRFADLAPNEYSESRLRQAISKAVAVG